MAIVKDNDRSRPLVAVLNFDYDDLATTVETEVFNIPVNAIVTGGGVVVRTVSNAATSDLLDVGDPTDPDRYTASQVSLKSAGFTAFDITGFKYTGENIVATRTETGAPSAGSYTLILEYIVEGRGDEVQTD